MYKYGVLVFPSIIQVNSDVKRV